LPAAAGMNRFVWDMRCEDAVKLPGDETSAGGVAGPKVPPGTYEVRLSLGEKTLHATFQVLKDPRLETTQEELEEQYQLLLKVRDKLSETHTSILQLRSVRDQLAAWQKHLAASANAQEVTDAAKRLAEALSAVEEELVQTKARSRADMMNFKTRLNAKLAALPSVVASADTAPTRQSYQVYDHLSGQIDVQLLRLQQIFEDEVPAFNTLMRDKGVPAIILEGKT